MEFGSSLRAIHFHELLYNQKAIDICYNVDALVITIIADLADDVVLEVDELDAFIDDHYD